MYQLVLRRSICLPVVLCGIVLTVLATYSGRNWWIESGQLLEKSRMISEIEYGHVIGDTDTPHGGIMIAIPLFNEQGYVKFTSSVMRSIHYSKLRDVYLFNDDSTEYTKEILQNWYGRDVHINSYSTHSGLLGTILHILEQFIKSKYEILLVATGDLVFLKELYEFVLTNIDEADLTMSYRTVIDCKKQKKGLCSESIAYIIGSAMKKPFAESILKNPNSLQLAGEANVIVQDLAARVLSPVESLSIRIGQTVSSMGCHAYAESRNFNRCSLPEWIKQGIEFYHDRCNNANAFFDPISPSVKEDIYFSKPVVSYSLYGGPNPRYLDGALANSALMTQIYPEWKMWVYHDNSIPESVLQTLCRRDVRLINMTGTQVVNAMSWRFFVASEPVRRYIIRDIDSRLSIRERAAVYKWIKSDKKFHIMRDHPSHSNFAMSGGMWGGTHEAIPQMVALLRSRTMTSAYLQDMNFLNDVIWPIARLSAMQHDAFPNGRYGKVYPFPTKRIGYQHIGSVYVNGKMRQGDVDILKRRIESMPG